MKLRELIRDDFETLGDLDINIENVTFNSKEVTKGSLFVSVVGQNTDGHKFIDEAIEAGVSAVLFEKDRYIPKIERLPGFL